MSDARAFKRKLIGLRLREARQSAAFSQDDVATLLGLPRPAISQIETGRRGVYAEEIARLAELYHVEITWLLGAVIGTTELSELKLKLAAYELTRLEPDHLDRLIKILATMCEGITPNTKER
jgi:transcriptional regulator with XRE-family HTH domain